MCSWYYARQWSLGILGYASSFLICVFYYGWYGMSWGGLVQLCVHCNAGGASKLLCNIGLHQFCLKGRFGQRVVDEYACCRVGLFRTVVWLM